MMVFLGGEMVGRFDRIFVEGNDHIFSIGVGTTLSQSFSELRKVGMYIPLLYIPM